jgi:FkbM family methyltransferase
MKLSNLSPDRLAWLFAQPQFKHKKAQTLLRVLLWELHRIRNDAIELSFDGSRFQIDCHDGIGRLLYYFGEVDREIFAFLNGYLKPGFTVVDVGANVGIYSRFAATRVGPDGAVYSFEPNVELLPRLRANLSPLPVRLFPYAVSDRSGTVTFHVSDDTAKSSILADESSTRTVKVQCVTLDEFHGEPMSSAAIDYLKIDVEGFDYHVLLGAEKLFKNQMIKVAQIECTQDLREIRGFLLDNNYCLRRMLQTGALAPVLPDESLPHNLFAHPENFCPVVEPLPIGIATT